MTNGYSPRFLPFMHFLPSDAEFSEDTAFGMRPISPGSGQEFALALGGNVPREQFTSLWYNLQNSTVYVALPWNNNALEMYLVEFLF